MEIYIISRKLEVGHTQYFPHQTFHVEQLQTEEAAENSFSDISEVQRVGSEGANLCRANAAPILVWALLSPKR